MLFIGIDLGTSAMKLILMDEAGKIRRTARREYPLALPQSGWSEQEPEDWWRACREGIAELAAAAGTERIAAVGVAGQMHGLVALDEEDRVIRPAILWNDGRTGEETRRLLADFGEARLGALTGNIAFAGFTAPKLLWMRAQEPENFARIAKIMLPKDYLSYRLCGAHVTDPSDASGMLLLDVAARRWSPEMLSYCGVHESQLPELFESYRPVGKIKAELSAALGLDADCIVVAGAGDNAAAAVGMGVVGEGACNISLGTSGTLFIASERFARVDNHSLHSFCHANGAYHVMGVMLSAAACNRWWMDGILGDGDYAAAQAEIRTLGENRVFFLPYLMGERTPHNDERARGAFVGLGMDSVRADMTQAVLEGVAYGLRDGLEIARASGIRVTHSKICGGGAKSPLWRRILANVLNLSLERLENDEGPALGAAILAAVGAGAFPDVASACARMVLPGKTEYPEPELVAKYEGGYARFRRFYPALRPLEE